MTPWILKMDERDIFTNPRAEEGLRRARESARRKRPTEEEQQRYVQGSFFEVFENWSRGRDFVRGEDIQTAYQSAREAVREITSMYTLDDVSRFCREFLSKESYEVRYGVPETFISALTNSVIRDGETLELQTKEWVLHACLGVFHERGRLIIRGKVRDYTGAYMSGGDITVLDEVVGDGSGDSMTGGTLEIRGELRSSGFNHMKGGHGVITRFPAGHMLWNSSFNPLCGSQEGGTLEILCDAPIYLDYSSGNGLGVRQQGGEQVVHGDCYCQVNFEQAAGTTIVKGNVILSHNSFGIGYQKKGGETLVKGDVLTDELEGGGMSGYLIGTRHRGGPIHICGDSHGTLGHLAGDKAVILVDGNHRGDIDGYVDYMSGELRGPQIKVKGGVVGNVGCGVSYLRCEIGGDVHGNVGENLGHPYKKPENIPYESLIKIGGNVYGRVGDHMRFKCQVEIGGDIRGEAGSEMNGGVIRVGGGISKLAPTIRGHVYQRGKDVTYIPVSFRILKSLFNDKFGQ